MHSAGARGRIRELGARLGQVRGAAAEPGVSSTGPPRWRDAARRAQRRSWPRPWLRRTSGDLDGHEVVAQEIVVPLQRHRREEAARAAWPQLEVVGGRRAVAGLERAAARQQHRLDVTRRRTAAPRPRPRSRRRPTFAAHARDRLEVGVGARPDRTDRRRCAKKPPCATASGHAEDRRVVGRIGDERPAPGAKLKASCSSLAAAGDVEVRLRRAVAVAGWRSVAAPPAARLSRNSPKNALA